jgi:hypothetical protein
MFQLALSKNTFWRLLSTPGLWSSVIKAKYLHQLPVHLWYRFAEAQPTYGSHLWKKLSASLPIILNWLAWDPGDGRLIEVGRDSILDLGNKAFLSAPLRAHLRSKNLIFLHQFYTASIPSSLGFSWLSGTDLQLKLEHRAEWDYYTQSLTTAGIYLKTKADTLLWTGGDRSGRV